MVLTQINFATRCYAITWRTIVLVTMTSIMGCNATRRDEETLERLGNIDSRLMAIEQALSQRQALTSATDGQADTISSLLFPIVVESTLDNDLDIPATLNISSFGPHPSQSHLAPWPLGRDPFNMALLRLPHEREE